MSSSPGVGFQYPSQEVSWLKRDVLLFANSIGCTANELHFLYVRIQYLRHLLCPVTDFTRNFIQIFKSFQPIRLFSVNLMYYLFKEIALTLRNSLQTNRSRGHRLLLALQCDSRPRNAQIRQPPSRRRTTQNNLLQTLTTLKPR